MIEFENLEEFCAALHLYVAQTKKDWERVYRSWAGGVFSEIVKVSPQWSGNFAANWNFGVNERNANYTEFNYSGGTWDRQKAVFFRGHAQAINEAQSRTKGAREALKLTDQVLINNLTPYAAQFPNDLQSYFRPGNYVEPAPLSVGYAITQATRIFKEAAR